MNIEAVRSTPDREREAIDPHCLSETESAKLLRGVHWRRFAVMGDSYAQGVGEPSPGYADLIWPERVAGALRAAHPDLAYLNTGRMGQRTAEVRATQLDEVLAFRPDLVNVASGGNDLWVPEPDLDSIEADLDIIYTALHAAGAHVFAFTLANVFDVNPGMAGFRDLVVALNDRIRAVANRHQATVVEMWDHPVRTAPTLMSSDQVHFSMHGHAVLATEVVKALAVHATSIHP